jgi:hypothetical protein
MKVKYEFEEKDFSGRGQLIVRQSAKKGEISPTLVYKVGYGYPKVSEGQKPCLISMADGLVNFFSDMGALLHELNNDPFGYRPLTTEEIVQVFSEQGNRFP